MGSDWEEVKLADVTNEITVGFVGSMTSEYRDDGVPFLRSKNVEPLRINLNDLKYISSEFNERIKKSALAPGDVVIVRTGKPGSCCVIPDWLKSANCSDLVIVRCSEKINNHFLAFYVNSVASSHINAHLVGAVQQHFNVGSARQMVIQLPSLTEQKAIAHILGSLDDKIELNRQMNQTLESMAQALFKSWFVDFDPVIDNALAACNDIPEAFAKRAEARKPSPPAPLPEVEGSNNNPPLPSGEGLGVRELFPSEFEFTEEMGWIPKGWGVGKLQDLLILQRGFDLPKKNRVSGSFPLIASSGQDGTHAEFKAEGPGVVTGRSGRIGIVTFVSENFWPLNTTLWIKEYRNSNSYYAYFLLNFIDLEKYSTGSAVPTLNRNHIHSLPQIIPSKDHLIAFEAQVAPLFKKKLDNESNLDLLSKLRNTLLPKPLSGEIRIPDAEKLIEGRVV